MVGADLLFVCDVIFFLGGAGWKGQGLGFRVEGGVPPVRLNFVYFAIFICGFQLRHVCKKLLKIAEVSRLSEKPKPWVV